MGKQDSPMQKNGTTSLSYTIHKNQLKWIIDLNIRPETIKLLEENVGNELLDINLDDFLFCFFIQHLKQRQQKQK